MHVRATSYRDQSEGTTVSKEWEYNVIHREIGDWRIGLSSGKSAVQDD
jgi:hypothetical protein